MTACSARRIAPRPRSPSDSWARGFLSGRGRYREVRPVYVCMYVHTYIYISLLAAGISWTCFFSSSSSASSPSSPPFTFPLPRHRIFLPPKLLQKPVTNKQPPSIPSKQSESASIPVPGHHHTLFSVCELTGKTPPRCTALSSPPSRGLSCAASRR